MREGVSLYPKRKKKRKMRSDTTPTDYTKGLPKEELEEPKRVLSPSSLLEWGLSYNSRSNIDKDIPTPKKSEAPVDVTKRKLRLD